MPSTMLQMYVPNLHLKDTEQSLCGNISIPPSVCPCAKLYAKNLWKQNRHPKNKMGALALKFAHRLYWSKQQNI